jgi:hypothetical protein
MHRKSKTAFTLQVPTSGMQKGHRHSWVDASTFKKKQVLHFVHFSTTSFSGGGKVPTVRHAHQLISSFASFLALMARKQQETRILGHLGLQVLGGPSAVLGAPCALCFL